MIKLSDESNFCCMSKLQLKKFLNINLVILYMISHICIISYHILVKDNVLIYIMIMILTMSSSPTVL